MFFPAAVSLAVAAFLWIWEHAGAAVKGGGGKPVRLPVISGIPHTHLEFHYHFANFLVYGGAGSGKTKA